MITNHFGKIYHPNDMDARQKVSRDTMDRADDMESPSHLVECRDDVEIGFCRDQAAEEIRCKKGRSGVEYCREQKSVNL